MLTGEGCGRQGESFLQDAYRERRVLLRIIGGLFPVSPCTMGETVGGEGVILPLASRSPQSLTPDTVGRRADPLDRQDLEERPRRRRFKDGQ
jgi:hypothetical protein